MDNDDLRTLEKGLQELVAGRMEAGAATGLIERAGASGEVELVPLLRQLAAGPENRAAKFSAVEALWRLGEQKSYFIRNTKAYSEDKWLAYYSILVLARDPEDEETLQTLRRLAEASDDNQIRGAVAEAEHVRFLADQVTAMTEPGARAAWLLDQVRGGWNPITLDEGNPDPFMNAKRAWVEKELFELSVDHPREVAAEVKRVDLEGLEPDLVEAYRRHLCGLLSEETRRIYDAAPYDD